MNLRSRWINPVLEKEFRLRMRTVRSPLALLAYLAVIGLLAFAYLYVESQNRGPNGFTPEASRFLFYFLSGAQMVLVCFMAPGLTAGVISGEREKQTLSMLLTTQQSSAAIILSKLAASLSFMLLVVFTTLPIYSIVFLYGGISPAQLLSVFGFYVLVMLMLGSLGVMFSTLFQRTVVAVIVTYGSGLFLYVLTGLAALFLMAVSGAQLRYEAGFLLGLNPLSAMIGLFEPSFTNEFFRGSLAGLQMWHIFVSSHLVIAAFAVWTAVRKLRPAARGRKTAQPASEPSAK
ncbi:ABC transporter permease [Paenibacillus sp.]|uniref:ABC transporter permease n=1 Tax=Paenibacillus sp. TaxID=58172 RepID=UPI002D6A1104|nr:ABC transporter permease [Paenibacillus sp.]HZG86829.1 ABC transporter permease [Paenibacillus sp.]